MRFLKSIFIVLILNMNFSIFSQDLTKHLWKNRVLLLIVDNLNSEKLTAQIEALKTKNEGLKERKLVIYQVFPEYYSLINEENNLHKSAKIYNKYNTSEKSFKLVLIGLDGSVKLFQNNTLSAQKLFAVIDGMPVRKRELKTKSND